MANVGIFVSYARKDGAELALLLQKDLMAVGFDVWLDTRRIRGGASWTVEIEEAIDHAEVVLALLTPGSYSSEICRAEQLRSLRKGKCVVPLLAGPASDIPLHLEAKNYRDFTETANYASGFQLLLRDIEARKGASLQPSYRTTPATYITAPPTVANYIDRPDALRALRDALFMEDEHGAIALTALEGMGGIGKTVLAQALFKDEVVRQAFPDGLVWITMGREPTRDLTARLREITRVLGGAADETVGPETLYRTTIAKKAALIVIDDVWNKNDLDPFLAESPRSRFLFTTRDASIARFSAAREHTIALFEIAQARKLLALWAGVGVDQLPSAVIDILHDCGGLPLALSTVGALLRGAAPAEWADTAKLLHNADLTTFEEQLPSGQQSFFRAIDVSVKALQPKMQQHYGNLAVLLEDMPAPLPVLETLWNVDDAEARRIGRCLVDRSLAQRDEVSGGIRLHDLQLDYIRAQQPNRNALLLLHGAVRLSSHVIARDPCQFTSQLVGRLLPYRDMPPIERFITMVVGGTRRPWLRPLQATLYPPGASLVRILEGHSSHVSGVAVSADGRCAVSASWDKTLKVWDVERGRELRTLEGHSSAVKAVALIGDGRRAISASSDRTLKVWDVETGRELLTLEGHTGEINAVALSGDGQRAISASTDKTLKVWDVDKGCELRTLKGHSTFVNGVALSEDGRRAISASSDKTLKVWDVDKGCELRTLEGHSASVRGVAVTWDGRRAISASADGTLKVWDAESGSDLRTMQGHSNWVYGVALRGEGQVISASADRTLSVWDVESGRELRMLEGHSDCVYGVAVSRDGRRAVSASADRTLRVWDVESGRQRTLQGHFYGVGGLAVSGNGRLALSASDDGTLRVWDVETWRELQTLEGHSDSVEGVAVSGDGRLAVSASRDKTLKVWDVESGRELRTLEGHSDSVEGVAVSGDGRRAISASGDKTLKVWDVESGRELRTLEGHSNTVRRVAVSADGRRVVSASADGTLKVWDAESGHELRTLTGHSDWVYGVAVSRDGLIAISASGDKTLKVWDVESGRELRTLEGHSDGVLYVAMCGDGRRAVSASVDCSVKVWHLEGGAPLATFTCDARAWSCSFINHHKLIAGDAGGRVHLLRLEEPKVKG